MHFFVLCKVIDLYKFSRIYAVSFYLLQNNEKFLHSLSRETITSIGKL